MLRTIAVSPEGGTTVYTMKNPHNISFDETIVPVNKEPIAARNRGILIRIVGGNLEVSCTQKILAAALMDNDKSRVGVELLFSSKDKAIAVRKNSDGYTLAKTPYGYPGGKMLVALSRVPEWIKSAIKDETMLTTDKVVITPSMIAVMLDDLDVIRRFD